ncbi:MAG: A/G-specific adenine glycosylase [Methylococcales bacterium]|nr:A/G-specific adenine glycosylase [Methylococcales bacterium]
MTDADWFQRRVLAWYDQHGRKHLPWQQPASPYRVWVSEIMLQQTQVATVIPYFQAFIARFPDVNSLAAAELDQVLCHWAGLGYYARARNLHKAAGIIAARGGFPDTLAELCQLPGIGRSTAGAILSLAFGQSAPILDGNVKRVLARFSGLDVWPGSGEGLQQLWRLSEHLTPSIRAGAYSQAMMDLGALWCTRSKPNCQCCPVTERCIARSQGLTSVLPVAKPKKNRPERRKVWLFLTDAKRQVWLWQRPPVGLWSGLWCLPEFDDAAQARAFCLHHGIKVAEWTMLPEGKHDFSHFRLWFTPLSGRLRQLPDTIQERPDWRWCAVDDGQALAMPVPVKRLLQDVSTLS